MIRLAHDKWQCIATGDGGYQLAKHDGWSLLRKIVTIYDQQSLVVHQNWHIRLIVSKCMRHI